MKKVLAVFGISFSLMVGSMLPASAHVSAQSKGFTLEAGKSSRLWLSLGHGCTYKDQKYPTSVFKVVVPASAGKPTPEFHYGWKSSVVASAEVDSKNVPLNYTVTWTAKTRSHAIDPADNRISYNSDLLRPRQETTVLTVDHHRWKQ
jgi:hypothetical protein